MNLWPRLLRALLMALFRPRLDLADESRLHFRVWPTDLDFHVHMNNARYLAVMDLGRVDIILRGGLGCLAPRRRLQPVIAGAPVRFRRPPIPFERFTLRTRVIGWDAKWPFMEHRMERRGEPVCRVIVKALFLGRDGGVPPDRLADLLGHAEPSPALPRWVADGLAVEAAQDQPALVPVEEKRCVR
jgi:acyl-CoA thioesterase FadM